MDDLAARRCAKAFGIKTLGTGGLLILAKRRGLINSVSNLVKRLRRATLGNLGDVRSVGDSVFEMREFFGPGWRMYYLQRNHVLIVMLGGGDKSTQERDIECAKALAQEILDE